MANLDAARGFIPYMYENGDELNVSSITYEVKSGEDVFAGDPIALEDAGTSTVVDQAAAESLQVIGVAADTVLSTDTERTMRFYPVPKNALYIIQQATGGSGAADSIGGTADWVADASGTSRTRGYYATDYVSAYELSATVLKDANTGGCLIRDIAPGEVCGDIDNAAGEHVKFIVSFNETVVAAATTGVDAA